MPTANLPNPLPVSVSNFTGATIDAGNPLPVTTAQIGEVQASPTANTVLDRLKTLATLLTAQAGYLDGLETLLAAATPASELHIGQVGGAVTNPTANFTRPADTTAYASGDLVANSTTAGSVAAMSFTVARIAAGSFLLTSIKLHKSGVSVTNSSFRLHLLRAAPGTVTNGDNGAFSISGVADYVGAFDATIDRAFTDGAAGFGIPVVGTYKPIKLASGQTLYGLLEARAAYTPTSAEIFTVTLDGLQD